MIYVCFIDHENVLSMDYHGSCHVINIKTTNSIYCFTAEKSPTGICRVHGDREYLAVTSRTNLYLYTIEIPWESWVINVTKPIRMRRQDKPNYTPRLFVQKELWTTKIFSSRDGTPLTRTTPKNPVKLFSYYYDR